jgi:hypothetical protein
MAHTVGKPSFSWVVLLGAGLAVASALVLLAGPVGYRLGLLPLRTALLTCLTWGVYGGIAAAVVSLTGLVVTMARPREARRGILLAAMSFLVGVVLIGIPGRFRLGPPKPPIHDITTDTQEPPSMSPCCRSARTPPIQRCMAETRSPRSSATRTPTFGR